MAATSSTTMNTTTTTMRLPQATFPHAYTGQRANNNNNNKHANNNNFQLEKHVFNGEHRRTLPRRGAAAGSCICMNYTPAFADHLLEGTVRRSHRTHARATMRTSAMPCARPVDGWRRRRAIAASRSGISTHLFQLFGNNNNGYFDNASVVGGVGGMDERCRPIGGHSHLRRQ